MEGSFLGGGVMRGVLETIGIVSLFVIFGMGIRWVILQ